MAIPSLPLKYFILLLLPHILNVSQSNQSTWIIPIDTIHFIVTNQYGCTLSLSPTASTLDLHDAIIKQCNASFRFEIRLLNETIMSPVSFNNNTLCQIPRIMSIARELYHIWGEGFIIPLRIHALTVSDGDVADYNALTRMFGGSDSNVHDFEWYQFIQQCADSKICAVQDLCVRFPRHFICDDDGHLTVLMIHEKLRGYLDLTFLPKSVVAMIMDRNLLTDIFGLDQLAGKRLGYLDIRESPSEIDLEPLTRSSMRSTYCPLKRLRVSAHQISWSLLGIRGAILPAGDPRRKTFAVMVHQAVREWFHFSILQYMTVGHNRLTKQEKHNRIWFGVHRRGRKISDPLKAI